MAWLFINLWVFCRHLKLIFGHPLDIEKILSKPLLDTELNAYFDYFDGGWNGVVYTAVPTLAHCGSIPSPSMDRKQHKVAACWNFFFPFYAYSLKTHVTTSDTPFHCSSLQIWQFFHNPFFWADTRYTLKRVPLSRELATFLQSDFTNQSGFTVSYLVFLKIKGHWLKTMMTAHSIHTTTGHAKKHDSVSAVN